MTAGKVGLASVVAAMMVGAAGAIIALASGTPPNAAFVGTDKCKACHFKDYKSWQASPHGKNFAVLQGAEQKDPDCLKCHTTGYGKPGGFTSLEATPGLTNAGCEACHGPGSAHVAAAAEAPDSGAWDTQINKVPQNVCVECHNPHVSQKERVAKLRQERAGK